MDSVWPARDSLRGCEVLLASPRPSVYDTLSLIFESCQCRLFRLATCDKTVEFLCQRPMGVVICDMDLPDGTWKDLLNRVSRLPSPPNLIVASRFADPGLWAEVLNLGGYDLVLAPFEVDETVRITAQALMDWNRSRTSVPKKAPEVARPQRLSPAAGLTITAGAD